MITYHRAKLSEVKSIQKVIRDSWFRTYEDIYQKEAIKRVTAKWHSIKFLSKQIIDPKTLFLVAKDGDRIVAICTAGLVQNGKAINIQKLHVCLEYQRKGIGKRLTEETLKAFPKSQRVELEVEKQNKNAYSFYANLGFRKSGEKTFEVEGIRMPCYVMEKKIRTLL